MWYTMNFYKLAMPVADNRTYAGAALTCDNIKPLRGHSIYEPRPLGYRSKSNIKTVQRRVDGSIAFQLYGVDAVVWHSPDRVTITGYNSTSRTALIWATAPGNVYLTHDTLLIPAPGECYWSGSTAVYLPEGASVTIVKTSNGWAPDMETTVPFKVQVLNKAKIAAVRKQFGTTGFWAWVRAYRALLPEARGADHSYINRPALAEALERADYLAAFALIPDTTTVVNNGGWSREYRGPSRSAFSRFLSWLYLREGAVVTESHPVLTYRQWRTLVANNRFKNL